MVSRAIIFTVAIASTVFNFCAGEAAKKRGSGLWTVPQRPVGSAPEVARWLVSNTDWGSIATVSRGQAGQPPGTPFANPQSFSDGIANATEPHLRSTGTPYFYMTGLDETPQDLGSNPNGSLAITEAQISSDSICRRVDTEDPTCARIVLTGTFIDVTVSGTSHENAYALQALYSKHPEMKNWGAPGKGDHNFHIWKLNIQSIFFLDFYGGSSSFTVQEYLDANPKL